MDRASIDIRVDKVSQLFDSLDPSPFARRDLAGRAEDYIVGSARELPTGQPVSIVVHMPAQEARSIPADQLGIAFANYFNDRADHFSLELRKLLRIGRLSLVIGLGVLLACFVVGTLLKAVLTGFFEQYWIEGLVILGWVALWRPMEIFLYDWWPLLSDRRLYRHLATAEIVVRPIAETPSASG